MERLRRVGNTPLEINIECALFEVFDFSKAWIYKTRMPKARFLKLEV
jgi:hypothetical protein